jgi:hypothetical protein
VSNLLYFGKLLGGPITCPLIYYPFEIFLSNHLNTSRIMVQLPGSRIIYLLEIFFGGGCLTIPEAQSTVAAAVLRR